MNEKRCTKNVHPLIDISTLCYSYLSDLTGSTLAALKVL